MGNQTATGFRKTYIVELPAAAHFVEKRRQATPNELAANPHARDVVELVAT